MLAFCKALTSSQSQTFTLNEAYTYLEKYMGVKKPKQSQKAQCSERGATIQASNPLFPAVIDLRPWQPFSPNHDCQLH